MTERDSEAGRWASEGGADPAGPATHIESGHEPADTPTVGAPDDTDEGLPGQEHQPAQGRTEVGQPAPEEIGESG